MTLLGGKMNLLDTSHTKIAMHATAIKHHISPATSASPGGQVRVFTKAKMVKKVMVARAPVPKLSEQTRRTFEFISDPANAHLFSKEAARKAFAHVKV